MALHRDHYLSTVLRCFRIDTMDSSRKFISICVGEGEGPNRELDVDVRPLRPSTLILIAYELVLVCTPVSFDTGVHKSTELHRA